MDEYTGSQEDTEEIVVNDIQAVCAGATSEVYEYDVLSLRFSPMQPLPRLLTALYGHALEMDITNTIPVFNDKVILLRFQRWPRAHTYIFLLQFAFAHENSSVYI